MYGKLGGIIAWDKEGTVEKEEEILGLINY